MLTTSRASLVVTFAVLAGCGSPPPPAAAPSTTDVPATSASSAPASSAAPAASPEGGCGRALAPTPSAAKEGEECGGTTHLGCAEGLTCFAKYRCPESVGTCGKKK